MTQYKPVKPSITRTMTCYHTHFSSKIAFSKGFVSRIYAF